MCVHEFQMGMLSRMRNGYRSDNFLLGILCLELLQLRISLEEARSRNCIEVFQFGVTPNLRTDSAVLGTLSLGVGHEA